MLQTPPTTENTLDKKALFLGVLLPIFCLVADPLVFKSTDSGIGIFAFMRVGAYIAITIGIISLLHFIITQGRQHRLLMLQAYILILGGIIAFITSLVLLLLIIFGLFLAFGLQTVLWALLGLLPFIVAEVYFQQGKKALQIATVEGRSKIAPLPMLAAIFLCLLIPTFIQIQANHYVDTAISDIIAHDHTSEAAIARLRAAVWCSNECYEPIRAASYGNFQEGAYLRQTYEQISGKPFRRSISQ